MMQFQLTGSVNPADGKTGAGHRLFGAHTTRQTAHKSRFTAAQIANQLDNFAAFKFAPHRFAETQSIV